MSAALFPQRMRKAQAWEVSAIIKAFSRRGINIELRGCGKSALYVNERETGAVVVRMVKKRRRPITYTFERYGRLLAADIAELHTLTPATR